MHKEDGGQDNFATGVPVAGSGWHTSVIEWTPGEVRFFLDGELVGTSTESVPDTPMNWILQSETTLTGERARGRRRGDHRHRLGRGLGAGLT